MNLINILDGEYCVGLTQGFAGIPAAVGNLVHLGVLIIQVVVPILLVIWGMIDFAKGVMQSDEDKIKEGQKKFIQRLIAAVICFLVVTIVRLVANVVGSVTSDNGTATAWSCANQLINGTAGTVQ